MEILSGNNNLVIKSWRVSRLSSSYNDILVKVKICLDICWFSDLYMHDVRSTVVNAISFASVFLSLLQLSHYCDSIFSDFIKTCLAYLLARSLTHWLNNHTTPYANITDRISFWKNEWIIHYLTSILIHQFQPVLIPLGLGASIALFPVSLQLPHLLTHINPPPPPFEGPPKLITL